MKKKENLKISPSSLTNTILIEIEDWYKDHTPFRDYVIDIYNEINQNVGLKYRSTIHPFLSSLFTPKWFLEKGYQNDSYLSPIIENKVIYGRDNWLFYSGDNSIEYYEGTNILSEDIMNEWKNKFQELHNICKEKGIDFAIVVPPNKEQVFPEYMPSFDIQNTYKREQVFVDYMKENSDVLYIYPIELMQRIKTKYTPYYMQDTHWNSIGAFVTVMEIYKELNYPFQSIDDISILINSTRGGDLSNFTGFSSEYEDYYLDYHPDVLLLEVKT